MMDMCNGIIKEGCIPEEQKSSVYKVKGCWSMP